MGDLLLRALAAAGTDLAAGLLFVGSLVFIVLLIRGEVRAVRRAGEAEGDVKQTEIWDFPPRWVPPRAETDLDSGRKVSKAPVDELSIELTEFTGG